MLTGAGQLILTTTGLNNPESIRGENLLMPGCIASFSLTPEENNVDALCLEDNIVQVAASAITQRTWSMSLEFQYQDWATIQLAYDEIAQEIANVTLPSIKTALIDENGEVADPDINAANANDFLAYASAPKPKFLKVVTVAPANDDEVQYDETANKLVFTASNVGRKVTYRVNKTYSNIEAIGVAQQYDKFGSLQFSGIIGGTSFNRGMQIIVPQLNRISTPELTVNGDLVALTIEYRLATPFGERAPFRLYNLG